MTRTHAARVEVIKTRPMLDTLSSAKRPSVDAMSQTRLPLLLKSDDLLVMNFCLRPF